MTYTCDGRRSACGGANGTLLLWDPGTGQEVLTIRGQGGNIERMAFSPDGWRLATTAYGNLDRTVHIYNAAPLSAPDLTPRHSFAGSRRADRCLAFSPDGSQLACGDQDPHIVRVQNATTGETTHILPSEALLGPTGVAFNREGDRIAVVGGNSTVDVWHLQTGRKVWDKHARELAPYSLDGVAYSPNGRYLAVGDIGGACVHILDAETGQPLGRLDAEGHFVGGVAYRPDGQYLAAACNDRSVRFWDIGRDISSRSTSPRSSRGTRARSPAWPFAAMASPSPAPAKMGW